jgi:hypothetical protein
MSISLFVSVQNSGLIIMAVNMLKYRNQSFVANLAVLNTWSHIKAQRNFFKPLGKTTLT